jgi:hypothetical protein
VLNDTPCVTVRSGPPGRRLQTRLRSPLRQHLADPALPGPGPGFTAVIYEAALGQDDLNRVACKVVIDRRRLWQPPAMAGRSGAPARSAALAPRLIARPTLGAARCATGSDRHHAAPQRLQPSLQPHASQRRYAASPPRPAPAAFPPVNDLDRAVRHDFKDDLKVDFKVYIVSMHRRGPARRSSPDG